MNRLLLILLISVSFAQKIDITSSEIKYYGNHFLHSWIGISSKVKSTVIYDGLKKNGSVSIKVPLSSFDSKVSSRDSNMLFYTDAIDYPNVKFKSTEISMINDSVRIVGNLSFHGITKSISTKASINTSNGFKVQGSFIIKLSDYNVPRPTFMFIKIDDQIRIEYTFQTN
ncbi:MAG: YceI family protein [Candidatus Marinimicrobia bacterium]|nr:YceI family protein [Candidatus Neomarinimicrobiota bacterium]